MSVVSLLLLLGVVAAEEFFELVEVRGAVSFLQRAARATPAAIDHPATLYALPLAATFRPRDYVRVLLRFVKTTTTTTRQKATTVIVLFELLYI